MTHDSGDSQDCQVHYDDAGHAAGIGVLLAGRGPAPAAAVDLAIHMAGEWACNHDTPPLSSLAPASYGVAKAGYDPATGSPPDFGTHGFDHDSIGVGSPSEPAPAHVSSGFDFGADASQDGICADPHAATHDGFNFSDANSNGHDGFSYSGSISSHDSVCADSHTTISGFDFSNSGSSSDHDGFSYSDTGGGSGGGGASPSGDNGSSSSAAASSDSGGL